MPAGPTVNRGRRAARSDAPGEAARAHVERAAARLAAAGVPSPEADAEWLLAALLGVGRAAVRLGQDEPLDPGTAARYGALVVRRAAREPLQHIVGWEEFRGLRVAVTPDVLVPRPETEMLVEWALGRLLPDTAPRVVDAGTGSGCIACAIAAERPRARVVAVERSAAALAVARANVDALGLRGRVRLVAGDLLEAVAPASVDLVVSNPPYLPTPVLASLDPEVRRHEPRLALDGGPDGLAVIARLLAGAGRALRPGGWLFVETAGDAQAAAVADRAPSHGLEGVEVRRDLAGVVRFVAARGRGRR